MHGINLWVIKIGKTVLDYFIKVVNQSNHKPNKLWVYQGREFFNNFMQELLENNDILISSRHNEGDWKSPSFQYSLKAL